MASSRKAFEPRRELDLDVGLERVEAGWTRDMAELRPLPIEARLRPDVGAVGVGQIVWVGVVAGVGKSLGLSAYCADDVGRSLIEVVRAWANYIWAPRPAFLDPANNYLSP